VTPRIDSPTSEAHIIEILDATEFGADGHEVPAEFLAGGPVPFGIPDISYGFKPMT
jgi:hypothetical protein